MRTGWKVFIAAVAAASLAAAGACSSGSDGGGSGAGSSSSPITIAVLGQFQATSFAYPLVPPVIKAAVDTVNANGGVNGHQIKTTVCNDQGTLPGATNCVRQAVSSDAVAVLVAFTRYGDAVFPLLQQAGLVGVGNVASTAGDYTNPSSFPAAEPAVYFSGLTKKMLDDGCKNLTFIHWDTPTSQSFMPLLKSIVADAGAKLLDKNMGASGTSDYGPVAQSIHDAGSTCGVTFLPGADSVKWTIAQRQVDPKFVIGGSTQTYSSSVLSQYGSAGNDLLLANSVPDPTATSIPEVAQFVDEMHKQGLKDGDLDEMSLQAYASLKLMLGAIGSVQGNVDKSSVTAAMNKITKPATTLLGSYNTTQPNSNAAYARAFSTLVYLNTTKDGKYVFSLGPPIEARGLVNK